MKTTVKTGFKSSVSVEKVGRSVARSSVELQVTTEDAFICKYMDASAAYVLGHSLIRLAEQIEAEQAERAAA